MKLLTSFKNPLQTHLKRTTALLAAGLVAATLQAFAAPAGFQPGNTGLFPDYPIAYRLDARQDFSAGGSLTVKSMEPDKLRITAGFKDGGGITGHSLSITAVEKTAGETVVDLLVAVNGQPGKALFGALLTADMTAPAPGRYRIRLWLEENFSNNEKRLLGEAAIVLTGKSQSASEAARRPVDGFAGVPWGAAAPQIDTAMQAQGAIFIAGASTPDKRVYEGTFHGETCIMEFRLINNRFFAGNAHGSYDGPGDRWWHRLLDSLTAAYGIPRTFITKSDARYSWRDLPGPAATDKISIEIYSGFWLNPKPTVTYHNYGLEKRLLAVENQQPPQP